MPRQRRGPVAPARSAPNRPSAAPARANQSSQQPQNRPATSAAYPAAAGQTQSSQGSGLFGQMASTAAGVAVGSSIGHAIGGFFGGGSTQAAEPQQTGLTATDASADRMSESSSYGGCEGPAKAFTRCLDDNAGPHAVNVCSWYLEQLKACQASASNY